MTELLIYAIITSVMSEIPTHKVGVVVLCETGGVWRTLLVRPKPKHRGGQAPFVLPRGSRQYRDPSTDTWLDARTREDAVAHATKEWEPFEETARRELEEEAGIPLSLMDERGLTRMGKRDYCSPDKNDPYPIYWFRLILEPEDISKLVPPSDAEAVAWFTLKEMEEAAALGEARPGYVAIVREAMTLQKSEVDDPACIREWGVITAPRP